MHKEAIAVYARVIVPAAMILLAWLVAAGANRLFLTMMDFSLDGPWGVPFFYLIPDLKWIVLPVVLVAG